MSNETFELAKPLADRVLIEKEEVQTKTIGGIIIPETARAEDTKIGMVVSTGPGVLIPMTVKVGDKVMMPQIGTAQTVKLNNKEYYLFREMELLMVIK
jgi:chaperonin GroES